MVDKPLKVGIIGANWALMVHAPAWRRLPGVEVAAVCTSRRETAEKAASRHGIPKAYWNHEEMSADPDLDIIDVGTRPSFRFPMVMAALNNGKHVYETLPYATSVENALAMRDLQKQKGVVGVVDAQFRWTAHGQQMKAMIDAGFIGKPLGFNMQVFEPLFVQNDKPYSRVACADGLESPYYWLAEKSSGGSAWRNFATHGLLFLTHLLGPVAEGTGLLSTGVPTWYIPNGDVLKAENHDLGTATLRLRNGAIGNLQTGWAMPDTEAVRVEVWGDRGRLLLTDSSFGNIDHAAKLYAGDARKVEWNHRTCEEVAIDPRYYTVPGSSVATDEPRDFIGMDWMFTDMLRAIRESREGSPSFTEAATVHQIVEGIESASEERRWVSFE